MRTTTRTRRIVATRLASVALGLLMAGVAVLADPYSGAAYAATGYDPSSYWSFAEGQFGPGTAPVTGTDIGSAAGDVEATEVCIDSFPLCAGAAVAVGGVMLCRMFGSCHWHWGFGGGHPSGPGTPCATCNSVVAGYGFGDPVWVAGSPGKYYIPSVTFLSGAPGNCPGSCSVNVYFTGYAGIPGLGVSAPSPNNLGSASSPLTASSSATGLAAVCFVGGGHTLAAWGPSEASKCGVTGSGDGTAGSVTVTGHCYNATTFAPDGDVTGTSSWASDATTVPDTDLPACPDGDFLGGVTVEGTGSDSGGDTGIGFVDGGLGGSPGGGTLTGTDPTGGPIPQPCLSQSSSCAAVWEEAEGSLWIKVSPQDVPVNHAEGFRCELVTQAGLDVEVEPDGACPSTGSATSPEPSPTTTTTATPLPPDTTFGPPKDSRDPTGNDLDLGSCFPQGWGLLNPVEWVLKPIVCAFAPDEQKLAADSDVIKSSISGSAIGTVSAAVGDLISAVTAVASDPGSCEGPELPAVPTVGLVDPTYPLSACADPMATWASITHGLLSFMVFLGGGWVALNVVAQAFGFTLPWKRIAWWENSEQMDLL